MIRRLKAWARRLRADALALWYAARDARTPLPPKILALALAAYAFSPLDLIPDFIPIIGLLDEAILLPLALWLVIRLIPPTLMAEFRAKAEKDSVRPVSRLAAAVVVVVWLAGVWLAALWVWPFIP